MKDNDGVSSAKARRSSHHVVEGPAIQVICLGAGGGPTEDNVTGFLVRSTASKWSKGSLLAVDAGSHLAAITRILEEQFPLVSESAPTPTDDAGEGEDVTTPPIDQDTTVGDVDLSSDREPTPPPERNTVLPTGPFAGLPFPHASARANAVHVVREHVSTYLITHPHLDHVSGFVINTAAFHNTSRPKRLAALPSTVNAIKTHIFNDIIWPNLTDEDGGVGFVTFQRLAEGGNIALGEGPGSGFIEVCDGLGAKGFKVSHGHCMRPGPERFAHRGSIGDLSESIGGASQLLQNSHPRAHHHHLSSLGPNSTHELRSSSFSFPASGPGTPLAPGASPDAHAAQTQHQQHSAVVDSTAYFIRAEASAHTPAREILVFGDVEPDSLSLFPRTYLVWREAAPKIASGILTGIFIECSYNNSQGDAVLFGHLAPRHVIQELQSLASVVREERVRLDRERDESRRAKKRKRTSSGFIGSASGSMDDSQLHHHHGRMTRRQSSRLEDLAAASNSMPQTPSVDTAMMESYALSPPLTSTSQVHPPLTPAADEQLKSPTANPAATHHARQLSHSLQLSRHPTALAAEQIRNPLKGLKVIIIHVKDTLADGRPVGESILQQLNGLEAELQSEGKGLGCEFFISRSGGSYWF